MSRVLTDAPPALRVLHVLRCLAMRHFLAAFRRLGDMLKSDLRFREFHEGRSSTLPDFYRRVYAKKLGRYAELLSPSETTPELEQSSPLPAPKHSPAFAGPPAHSTPDLSLSSTPA